jgi:hypothetical protein
MRDLRPAWPTIYDTCSDSDHLNKVDLLLKGISKRGWMRDVEPLAFARSAGTFKVLTSQRALRKQLARPRARGPVTPGYGRFPIQMRSPKRLSSSALEITIKARTIAPNRAACCALASVETSGHTGVSGIGMAACSCNAADPPHTGIRL